MGSHHHPYLRWLSERAKVTPTMVNKVATIFMESIGISIFLMAMIFFCPFEPFIENHLVSIALPQNFTPIFLPVISPLSIAPQELPPPLQKTIINPLFLAYQQWWCRYPTRTSLSCTCMPHPNQYSFWNSTIPIPICSKPPTNNSSPPSFPTQHPQAPTVNATPKVLNAESRGTHAAAVAYPSITFRKSQELLDPCWSIIGRCIILSYPWPLLLRMLTNSILPLFMWWTEWTRREYLLYLYVSLGIWKNIYPGGWLVQNGILNKEDEGWKHFPFYSSWSRCQWWVYRMWQQHYI